MLQFIVSVIGVLVFTGLTAYDTQRLKNDYIYGYASTGLVAERARDHRRAQPLPELHQPVHAAASASRPARLALGSPQANEIGAPASPPGLFFCGEAKIISAHVVS